MDYKDKAPKAIVGTVACMSLPRLSFTDNMFCVLAALAPLGVPIHKGCGAFWGQVMCSLWDAHLNDGTRYLLTIDYDTVFTLEDVVELHRLMAVYPDAEAIFATQVSREANRALCGIKDPVTGKFSGTADPALFAGEVTKAHMGHFGLTLIRTSMLRKLPRPWMLQIPDASGGWGEGHQDMDGYFWRQAMDAGLTVYQANSVPIGHIQRVVSWPLPGTLAAVHQYLDDFDKQGMPANVRRKAGAA